MYSVHIMSLTKQGTKNSVPSLTKCPGNSLRDIVIRFTGVTTQHMRQTSRSIYILLLLHTTLSLLA